MDAVPGLVVLLFLLGGGTGLEPNGGYCIGSGCFALFRDPTNFRTAQSLCNAKGGHLMTVRSSVSNDVLSILLGNLTGVFWIGLHRLADCRDPAGELMGFQWVTKDSESDFTNFVPSFNSSCSAHSCVSVNKEDGFKWRQTPCGQPAAGFLCEYSFTEPCATLPAAPDQSILYMTPYGFEVEDAQLVPPGSTATRSPSGTKHICFSAEWLQAPWSCEIQEGGCEHECAEDPSDSPVCFCPPGQTVSPANRVSCEAPAPGDPCAALRCQQTCYTDADGSARCGCEHGLTLAGDGTSCADVDECADARHCPGENVRCVNTRHGFECACEAGYKKAGVQCVDVDECVSAPCEHICTNAPGGFTCACYDGYRPDAEELNKCVLFCGAEECPAVCDPNDPLLCYCPEGYVVEERDKGMFCLDIDECSFFYCDQGCTNMFGSYACFCNKGYKLVDQYKCEDTDEEPEGSVTAPTSSVAPSPSAPYPDPTRTPSAVTPAGLVGIIVCAVLLIVLAVFGVHVGLGCWERKRKKSSCGAGELKAAEDETQSLQRVISDSDKNNI
ncbi:thrombomodulin [Kryptolebias marmoratus]|uniref:thrombomodulin n=1 Tax=Kryptolebias marmoratus TaxID=37003 RepID=UPI0007F8E3AB|nr:thrombomodulin [Kryptolebias marmoratus]